MKNLIYQYYIPYESGDAHIGGREMPDWAKAGMRSAQAYAKNCGAEYLLETTRFDKTIDPRLDSIRLYHDPKFEQYDMILSIDLDMLIATRQNIFKLIEPETDVAMVHEKDIFTKRGGWLARVMNPPLKDRGIIAYGKHLWGKDWSFPKSKIYPGEAYRYMNGGLQLWTKKGREKARKDFVSVHDYYLHTRYTEQMYVNLNLSQPQFVVQELPTEWNRLEYQWSFGQPDGKINHFLGPKQKFRMPQMEKTGLSLSNG